MSSQLLRLTVGEITGQLRKLKALYEKTPGVTNPCSFRTAYTDAGGFAFEVNRRLTTVKYRRPVQYFGLYRTRSAHSRTTGLQFHLRYVVFIVLLIISRLHYTSHQ